MKSNGSKLPLHVRNLGGVEADEPRVGGFQR